MTVGPLTWSRLVRGAARYGAPERSRSAAHAHSAPPPVGVTAGQGGARAPSSGTSEEGASPARGGEKSANSHSRPRRLSHGRGFQVLLSVSQWCHLVATPHIAAARHGLDTGQPALKGLASRRGTHLSSPCLMLAHGPAHQGPWAPARRSLFSHAGREASCSQREAGPSSGPWWRLPGGEGLRLGPSSSGPERKLSCEDTLTGPEDPAGSRAGGPSELDGVELSRQ